jgi:hypothetical protein
MKLFSGVAGSATSRQAQFVYVMDSPRAVLAETILEATDPPRDVHAR